MDACRVVAGEAAVKELERERALRADAEERMLDAEECARAELAAMEKAREKEEERRMYEVSLLRSDLEAERKRREDTDTYAQGLRVELREETAALRELLGKETSRCLDLARRAEGDVRCLIFVPMLRLCGWRAACRGAMCDTCTTATSMHLGSAWHITRRARDTAIPPKNYVSNPTLERPTREPRAQPIFPRAGKGGGSSTPNPEAQSLNPRSQFPAPGPGNRPCAGKGGARANRCLAQ